MTPLCRHILPAGRHCSQPAVHGTLFCRHHGHVRVVLKQASQPAPYGVSQPLPLVFPEDRKAIQLNLHLVNQALNDNKIDIRKANALTNNLRASMSNLTKMEQEARPNTEDTIQRVILTPEGEEIALPREHYDEGESPRHHNACPCQRCAEQYRNAAPEQHHPNCQCGLCEPTTDTSSQAPTPSTTRCHPERSAQREVEGPAFHTQNQPQNDPEPQPSTHHGCHSERHDCHSESNGSHPEGNSCHSERSEESAVLSPSEENGEQEEAGSTTLSPIPFTLSPALRSASATKLYHQQQTKALKTQSYSFHDYIYGDKIKQHEAQYAARARAALEAGIDPPPYEPWDINKYEPEGIRRYKETLAQVERNKQAAKEAWDKLRANEAESAQQEKPNEPQPPLTASQPTALLADRTSADRTLAT
jgi:hypothetical protein